MCKYFLRELGAKGGAITSRHLAGIGFGTIVGGVIGGFVGEASAEKATDILLESKSVNVMQLLEKGIVKPIP